MYKDKIWYTTVGGLSGSSNGAAYTIKQTAAFPGGANKFLTKTGDTDLDPGKTHADGDYTVTCWVKFPTSASGGIFSKGSLLSDPAEHSFGLFVSANRMTWYHSSGLATTQARSAVASVTTGTWYFVAVTYDQSAGALKIALNNAAFVTGDATPTKIPAINATAYIGTFLLAGTNPAEANIGLIGMWDRVLTASELTSLYNTGLGQRFENLSGTLTDNLIAYINCTETSTGAASVTRAIQGAVSGSFADPQKIPSSTTIPGA